jgi:hypothetical protein
MDEVRFRAKCAAVRRFARLPSNRAWEYACEHLEPEKTTEAYLSFYTRLRERGR